MLRDAPNGKDNRARNTRASGVLSGRVMRDRSYSSSSLPRCIRRAACVAAAVLLGVALPAVADYRVGAGGTAPLATGRINLACTDLIVAGTLDLGGGAIYNIRDVIVQPGGLLIGGTGSITLSRDFVVQSGGQYLAQSSQLQYDTVCGPGRSIPTLGDAMLALLAALLGGMSLLVLRARGRRERQDTINGAMR